jgi:hypothetical protein
MKNRTENINIKFNFSQDKINYDKGISFEIEEFKKFKNDAVNKISELQNLLSQSKETINNLNIELNSY